MQIQKTMKIQALVALLLHHCHSASSRPLQETEYTLHEFRDFNGKSQFSLTSRGDGKFSGSLSAPLGTSTFDSITAKKGIEVNGEINTKKLIASNAIEGQSIKVAKSIHAESAKFESSVTVGDSISTKDGIVKGVLNVTSGVSSKGPIYAKSVSVVGLVEAKSMEASDFIKANKLNVAKDIVAGGKVVSGEGFFSREGTIKVKEVESNKLKVMEYIDAVSADFRGEVSISKKLQVKDTIDANSVSISNRLDVSANGGIMIEGSLSSKGQASFANGFEANGDVTMKRVLVSQIELVQQQGINAPIIDASKGSILVNQLTVNDGIKTDSMIVDNISAKELQVAGPSSFGGIDSNVIKTKSLEVNTILANKTSITKKLVAKIIETKNISISEDLFAAGAVLVSGDLSASSISASSLRVDGKVNVSESLSANDITAMDSFLTMGNATINEGLDVKGSITGSFIFVGDLAVGGPLERSRLGCMSVSSVSGVDIEGSLSVALNTIMNQSLSVRERINATDISAQELIVDRLFSNELLVSGPVNATNVTSSDGFFSDGDIVIGHVTAAGNISVHGEIATPVLRATDVLIAKQASVDDLNVQSNLKVGNATSFEGEVEFSSGTIFKDLVSMNKLIVRAAEIQNGLEVGSLFTKRVYAQDIAATGFITAASIMSKGDVNVTGTVNTFGLAAVNVNVKDVDVSNELRCSTARIEGVLDSAGITAHKVSVKGDLLVKGMDVINAIEKLEKRIIDLEQMLATLHSQIEVGAS